MDVFGGVIRLQDDVSGVLRGAAQSARNFQSDVASARQALNGLEHTRVSERTITVNTGSAVSNIGVVSTRLQSIRNRAVVVTARAQNALSSIRNVGTRLRQSIRDRAINLIVRAPVAIRTTRMVGAMLKELIKDKIANIKAKVSNAVNKIKTVASHLKKIKDNKVVKFVAKGVKAFGGIVAKLGLAGVAAGFGAVTAAGTLALKSAMDFEKGMANVGTLLDGDVKGKLSSMGESLKTISKDTGVDLNNLSGGLYEVVSAFGESADSTKQLEIAAKAAKAGNAETSEAVKMLSAVTKGYGDTSAEAVGKAADLAFETVKLGQTSFPELASSMGAVIPLASTLKVSQEELFGAMATLTGVTGGTAEVTTQLKATMQGFMSPTAEMSAALKKMGYASGAAALESEGLGSILNKLKDSVNGDEVAFAGLFSSVEAKNAVLALAGSQAENFVTKTDAMTKASGAAEGAFQQQNKSVAAMAGKIKNYGMVMLTSIGEKALPIITDALDKVMTVMPSFESSVGKVFDAVGPVLLSIGNIFSDSANKMGFSFENVTSIIADAVTVVGNVITAIAPVISGILQGVGSIVEAVFPAIASVMSMVGEKIVAVYTMLGSHSQLFQGIIETMGPIISGVISGLGVVIGGAFDVIIAAVDLCLSAFEKAFPAIEAVVKAAWSVIEPIINGIGKGISVVAGAVKNVAGFIGGSKGSVGANATGTSYWRGGYTTVGEHGPELINLPAGSKVHSNSDTQKIIGGKAVNINIGSMVIREEADIDKVTTELVKKMKQVDR
jgi:phage tail tape measure protein, TP901 family|nr:MAG TPA: minor tail protein [Caudoviricetes sp.]